MSESSQAKENRYSAPPAYKPPIPPRESKGYAVFPTGDVSHTRAFSTGYGGGEYRKEQTHPLKGQMERDYGVYKAVDDAFNATAKTYRTTKEAVMPPEDRPSTMATYGPGQLFTPPGHRALINLAAQSSRLAYETNQGRAYFEEQHVGRGFESLKDHKNHRKQKNDLLLAQQNFAVLEAKHTKFAAFPEYRQPPAGSAKKGPK